MGHLLIRSYVRSLMLESIERSETNIFVDLDETLVKTVEKYEDPSWRTIWDDYEPEDKTTIGHYISVLRPGAREFLKNLSQLGAVHICTWGTEDYARSILDDFRLNRLVKYENVHAHEIMKGYLWKKNDGLKTTGRFVLVDNLPSSTRDVRTKLFYIGIPKDDPEFSRYHVQCSSFDGDPADRELSRTFREVKHLLSQDFES